MNTRIFTISRVDWYLLRVMMPRMGLALLVTLVALLMERILRLIDLVTTQGAPLKLVLEMAVNLVPHYLGLALPATLCIAVLTGLSALSRGNEIDALEGAGWSLRRIGAPFIVLAAVLAMISLPLFGFLQPYSRYAYSAIKHAALNSGWSGRVEEGVFVDAGNGLFISAGEVDPTGQVLYRIFVSQREGGSEAIFTARVGVVIPDETGQTVRLRLKDGRGLVAGGWLNFDELDLSQGIAMDRNPFRPRGGSERELTFGELLTKAHGDDGFAPEPRYLAEFHARLVRAVALIGVALMSIPLGVTRKRAPIWPRMALALAILVAFNHILQTVQSLSLLGRIDPVIGLWGVCAVFMLGCGWLYSATPGQGARSPLRTLLRQGDILFIDAAAFWRRLSRLWGADR